jgi:hypothetical protein
MDKKNYQLIPIGKLELNNGQLQGLPKNPRYIKDERYEALKKSIGDAPEMLEARMLLVYPLDNGNFIVLGGNMRLRVCKELGFTELPCFVFKKETSVEKLKEYVIKDNVEFGNIDWDSLANDDWDVGELGDWGMDTSFLGGDAGDVDSLFENLDDEKKKTKDIKIEVIIPEEQGDIQEEVKAAIEELLADYEGIKVK